MPPSPIQHIKRQKPNLLKSLDYKHIRVNVLPTLHKKYRKTNFLGSSNLQHKCGTGRKLCKKKSEHSTDPAVLLKLSNLSLYTQMYLHSFINRSRNHRSGNSLLHLMSVLLWIMLVYVYFSNCFLLRTFQIKCTLVPNYYSQWLVFSCSNGRCLRAQTHHHLPLSDIVHHTSIINHVNISYQCEICWSINSTSAVFRVLASRRDTFNL